MRIALAVLVLVIVGCEYSQPKSPLDRCVDEKMVEYDRLWPGTEESRRQNARDGHRIFCEIYLRRPRANQENGLK